MPPKLRLFNPARLLYPKEADRFDLTVVFSFFSSNTESDTLGEISTPLAVLERTPRPIPAVSRPSLVKEKDIPALAPISAPIPV
ncbi:hypothetical protein D3C72_2328530 [compost metagenome]